MDRLKAGGFGCTLGFAAGLIGIAGFLGASAAAELLSYLLAIAGALLVAAATQTLRAKFGFRLFLAGGILAAVGVVAAFAAATLAAVHATGGARDVNVLSPAMVGFGVASSATLLGWMFIGASLVLKRRAIAKALGAPQEVLILATGILLVLSALTGPTFAGPLGLAPLAFILFALARAPAAPAAAPQISNPQS